MPRGRRNDDDSNDEGTPHRNHYWSLRDIPKFEGKGEQPFSHLMEFEDYLVAYRYENRARRRRRQNGTTRL